METKVIRKNTGSTTVIMIIMMVLLVGLGGFITYTQSLNKKENQTDNKVEEQTKEKINVDKDVEEENINDDELDYDDEDDDMEEKTTCETVSYDSGSMSGKNEIVKCYNIDEYYQDTNMNLNFKYISYDGDDVHKIQINDKKVKVKGHDLNAIYYLGNNILIVETSGTDIRSTIFYFFDKKGNQIYKINSLFDGGMAIDGKLSFGEDKISFKATRFTHNSEIVTNKSNIELLNSNGCMTKSIYDKYKDYNVEGEYEIKYLGNNKFSNIKNKEYIKLKNSTHKPDLCK